MVTITKTTPDLFFSFMDVVSSIQPCDLQTARQGLKTPMGRAYSVQNFSVQYGFVALEKTSKSLSLSPEGERLIHYTGNLRDRFIIDNIRLQFCEPFASLRNELSKKTQMTTRDVGDFLEMKFPQKRKWTEADKADYSDAVMQWLVFLQLARRNGKVIEYLGGEVKTGGLICYPEMWRLLDRTLYDFLTEHFHTPSNILDEPYALLKRSNEAKDDNEKGELFEAFIGSVFQRFGFSSRLRDGVRERNTNLTFEKSGGGDVALFCHFPNQGQIEIYHGCAIGCEAKATTGAVGSKAVGQARNLSKKIKENYSRYLVLPMILSQSICGYDDSGRRNAPPEVVHITVKEVLNLLDIQRKRLEKGVSLILPMHIVSLFEKLIKEQIVEPDEKRVAEIVNGLVSI